METKVTISLKNLEFNAKSICKKYKDYDYRIGVLKSNAYGHGYNIVNSVIKGGINYIAVSYLYEALKIREYNKDIPILCMQPISLDDISVAAKENITITVHSLNYLNELDKLVTKKIKVHLEIDSGMNRLGLKEIKEVNRAFQIIKINKLITLEGIYTHFATTGIFDKNWDNQVEKFKYLTSEIKLDDIEIVHLYSSTSLLDHEKLEFANAFRIGISLYGYNVSPHYSNAGFKDKLRNARNSYLRKSKNISKVNYDVDINLKRAMFMTTYLIDIKKVSAGESIGYGATKLTEDMLVGILPIGYSNGIGHSNLTRYVLINGKKYYAVGSMSMNMMMIKVDDSVSLDDEVVVLGGEITLGQMARFNNKQLSETLLDIGNNNKKVYVEEKTRWE